MKKQKPAIIIGLAVIACLVLFRCCFNHVPLKTTFAEYLEGKYGEPFTVIRAFKEYHSDRGMCYRIKAKSDRFDDPFVMFAYPASDENSKHVLEVKGKKYEMEDAYPEVIFQNQYLDKLRPLMGELPLMKCRIINEGAAITLDEVAAGMKAYLRDLKHGSWVTVYLLTDDKEAITPEVTQAIQSQMEAYHSYSYDLYIGILKPGKMVSEEEYYKNYDTTYGVFYDFMRNSAAFEDMIHLSGGRGDSTPESREQNGVTDIINEYFDENGYWKDIRALDYVDLSAYENLTIPAEEVAVTQEEIEQIVERLILPYGSKQADTDEMQYPEWNDAFVQEHFHDQYGWNTVEEAENACRKIMSDNKRYAYAANWISREVPVHEIPDALMEACSYIEVQKDLFYAKASNQSFEEYMPLSGGDTLEKYLQNLQSRAEEAARSCLQLQAIAETENLTFDSDDMNSSPNDNPVNTALGEGYRKMKQLQDKACKLLMQS